MSGLSHPDRICVECKRDMNIVGHGGHEMCPACNRRLKYQSDPEFRLKSNILSHEYQKNNRSKINTRRRFSDPGWQKTSKRHMDYRARVRSKALEVIGHGVIKCANCGCNDERFIEINHINGGGSLEVSHKRNRCPKKSQTGRYLDMIFGRRSTDDLNLLCKMCNALHYIELHYGKQPVDIIWRGDK